MYELTCSSPQHADGGFAAVVAGGERQLYGSSIPKFCVLVGGHRRGPMQHSEYLLNVLEADVGSLPLGHTHKAKLVSDERGRKRMIS